MGIPRRLQNIRSCAKLSCKKVFANPADCDFRFCKECRNGDSGLSIMQAPGNGRAAARRSA